MRRLSFLINGQSLAKDENCYFKGIVAGTENYLECVFTFNDEWSACKAKVVVFTMLDVERTVVIKNNKAMIPKDVLLYDNFTLFVAGSGNGKKIVTNSVVVEQERS